MTRLPVIRQAHDKLCAHWPPGLRLLALVVGAVAFGWAAGAVVVVAGPLYTAAGIVAVAGGLLLLRDTQWGLQLLIAVACLLPFAALPVNVGFTPTFLDVALLATFFVWLVRLLTDPDERLIPSVLYLPVLIFVVLAFASFISGAGYSISNEIVRHFLEVVLAVCLLFVVINTVRTHAQVVRLTQTILWAATGSAAVGLFLYFAPKDLAIRLLSMLRVFKYPAGPGVLRYIASTDTLRAISTSIDPNVLGGMLFLAAALAASQFFSPAPVLPRKWLVPMGAAMGLCLLLSYSRGSWLGLAAALMVMGALRYRAIWAVLVVGVLALYAVPEGREFMSHLESGFAARDQAAAMRLGEYKDALRLIQRYPWFGVGFGATPEIDLYLGVSNVYLLIAEEMGLIGLGSFLIATGVFFWHALRRLLLGKMADAQLQGLAVGFVAALAGAMVAGLFDHYFFNLDFPHSVALFWLYLGLAWVCMRLDTGDQPAPEAAGPVLGAAEG